jgi:hypothetical protein
MDRQGSSEEPPDFSPCRFWGIAHPLGDPRKKLIITIILGARETATIGIKYGSRIWKDTDALCFSGALFAARAARSYPLLVHLANSGSCFTTFRNKDYPCTYCPSNPRNTAESRRTTCLQRTLESAGLPPLSSCFREWSPPPVPRHTAEGISPSARTLFGAGTYRMQKNALNRNTSDWKQVRRGTLVRTQHAKNTFDTYPAIAYALTQFKESHSCFQLPDRFPAQQKPAMYAEITNDGVVETSRAMRVAGSPRK